MRIVSQKTLHSKSNLIDYVNIIKSDKTTKTKNSFPKEYVRVYVHFCSRNSILTWVVKWGATARSPLHGCPSMLQGCPTSLLGGESSLGGVKQRPGPIPGLYLQLIFYLVSCGAPDYCGPTALFTKHFALEISWWRFLMSWPRRARSRATDGKRPFQIKSM